MGYQVKATAEQKNQSDSTIVVALSKEFEIISVSDALFDVFSNPEEYIQQSKYIKKECDKDAACRANCQHDGSYRIMFQQKEYAIQSKTLFNSNGEVTGYIDFLNEVQFTRDSEDENEKISNAIVLDDFMYQKLFLKMNVAFAFHKIILKENSPVDYIFININERFEELTGLCSSDVLGKSVLDVLPKTEHCWIETYGKVALTGEEIEFEQYASELNKHFHVRAFSPAKGYFVTTFHDITKLVDIEKALIEKNKMYLFLNQELEETVERVETMNKMLEKTKKEAQENEELFFSIFNNAPISMLLLDENSDVVQINRSGYEISDNEVFIHKNVKIREGDVLQCIESITNGLGCSFGGECDRCKIREAVKATLLTGQSMHKVEAEVKTGTARGKYEIRTYLISTSQILKRGRKHVLVSFDDITAQKKIENDLIHAKLKAEESDRLKSSFLANMSHEIRTPLNGIVGFSNLMARNFDITPEQRKKYSTYITNGTESLLNIMNDIIEISRIESGILEIKQGKFDVNTILVGLKKRFDREIEFSRKNINLSVKMSDEPLIIVSDENRLIQIFEGLLNNALKFTQEGRIEFGIKRINEFSVNLFVSDTGIGIAKEQHKVIFERFRQVDEAITRKYGGNGLGLAIVNEILKLLNGTINVESEIGKGSTFMFELPLSIGNEDFCESINLSDQSKEELHVLVVEDDEINLVYLLEVLEEPHFKVEVAENGAKAVELCEKHNFDVILMDIQMPVMNGFEAVRKIREFNKDVYIIAQTAYAMAGDADKVKEFGCDDYISKPIDIDLLHEKIWLRNPRHIDTA